MEMIVLIGGLSTIMWYIIDRFKVMWSESTYGAYVTMGISMIFAFSLAFGYDLDLVFGLGLSQEITMIGTILTGFSLMAGSSAISEIIGKVKSE